MDNSNGRKWARFTLALALLASVGGNVGHTMLATSVIPEWLRMIGAVLWPFFTFLGIEVLVRIYWERSFTHHLARNMVLFPAVPAAIVSYEHLYSFLGFMGERQLIQIIGPIAIDGAMIGMTMVLLFTHKLPVPDGPIVPVSKIVQEFGEARETLEEELERITLADMLPQPIEAPVSPAPIARERAPRAGNGEREQMVRDMLADPELRPVNSTMRRYASVARTLRDNADAEIDPKGVRPEIVENIIRPWARLERVR